MMLEVRFPSRIHFTLLGMDEYGYRINGGSGFAFDGLLGRVRIKPSSSFTIEDSTKFGISQESKHYINDCICAGLQDLGLSSRWRVQVCGNVGSQLGIGLQTAVILSGLEAIGRLEGATFGRGALIQASRRGGTSGIGINTYFSGSYVLDLGQRRLNSKPHRSSDSLEQPLAQLPLLLLQYRMPNWGFLLFIPDVGIRPDLHQEAALFASTCPLRFDDTRSALYEVVSGLTASIIESDYTVFCSSLNVIQSLPWKRSEWNLQGKHILKLKASLDTFGADAVGLSSVGPAMLLLARRPERLTMAIRQAGIGTVYRISPNDCGREIEALK